MREKQHLLQELKDWTDDLRNRLIEVQAVVDSYVDRSDHDARRLFYILHSIDALGHRPEWCTKHELRVIATMGSDVKGINKKHWATQASPAEIREALNALPESIHIIQATIVLGDAIKKNCEAIYSGLARPAPDDVAIRKVITKLRKDISLRKHERMSDFERILGRIERYLEPRAVVFISYSHKDRKWLDLFRNHLKPFNLDGKLHVWDDTRMASGDDWEWEIDRVLKSPSVAVLLVSANFLASEFILKHELPLIVEAARRGTVKLMWVPVSESAYAKTELKTFHAASEPSRPLDCLDESELNRTLVEISTGIRDAVAPRQ